MEVNPSQSPEYVSPSEGAAIIGNITAARLRDWAERGHIRGRRLPSGRWQLLRSDVEQISSAQWRDSITLDEAKDKLQAAKSRLSIAEKTLETARQDYNHALATVKTLEQVAT